VSAEVRARRLGVALATFGVVNEPPRDAMLATWPLLSPEARAAWQEGDDEDVHLANACLEVERELRDREWSVLQTLLSLMPPEHMAAIEIPSAHYLMACRFALDIGWLHDGPDEDAG
jgi:hypothetical protein